MLVRNTSNKWGIGHVRLWREISISLLQQRCYSDFEVISKMLRISIKCASFQSKVQIFAPNAQGC